jgi:hypothetical protein
MEGASLLGALYADYHLTFDFNECGIARSRERKR